jgi:hypothetical protein
VDIVIGMIGGFIAGIVPGFQPTIAVTAFGASAFSMYSLLGMYVVSDAMKMAWMTSLTTSGDNPSLHKAFRNLVKSNRAESTLALYSMSYYFCKVGLIGGACLLLLLNIQMVGKIGEEFQVYTCVVFIATVGVFAWRYRWRVIVPIVGIVLLAYWVGREGASIPNIPMWIGVGLFGVTSLIEEIGSKPIKVVQPIPLSVSGDASWSLGMFCGFVSSFLWGVSEDTLWELTEGKGKSDVNKVLSAAVMRGSNEGLTLIMAVLAVGAKHEIGETLTQAGYVYSWGEAMGGMIILVVGSITAYLKMDSLSKFVGRSIAIVGRRGLAVVSLIITVGLMFSSLGMGAIGILLIGGSLRLMAGPAPEINMLVIMSIPVVGLLTN